MRGDPNREHEISGRPAHHSGRTMTGDADAIAVSSAGRNAHRDFVPAVLQSQPELGTTNRRREVDADLGRDIGTFHASAAAPAAPAAEQIAEQIAEAAGPTEHVVDPARRAARSSATGRLAVRAGGTDVETFAQAILPELIVNFTFFWITQRLVSAVHRLEPRFGLLVAGALVGMELGGELSVRLFDLVGARR